MEMGNEFAEAALAYTPIAALLLPPNESVGL